MGPGRGRGEEEENKKLTQSKSGQEWQEHKPPRPLTGPTTGREKQKKGWKSSGRPGLKGLKCHKKQSGFHPTGTDLLARTMKA